MRDSPSRPEPRGIGFSDQQSRLILTANNLNWASNTATLTFQGLADGNSAAIELAADSNQTNLTTIAFDVTGGQEVSRSRSSLGTLESLP